jgi:hypothetical protein
VLEWIKIANDTVIASGTSPLFTGRQMAMVSAAMFDGPRAFPDAGCRSG